MTTIDERLDSFGDHPFRHEVDHFRRELLAADDAISETWKWNAPSFRFDGADCVTFRLRPGAVCQLILHRGAARSHGPAVELDDDSIEWKSSDRGVISLASPSELRDRRARLVDVCLWWMRAVS
jgi:hypothetical protein